MPDEPSLAKAKTVVEPGEAIPLAPPARRDNPMVVLTADQLAEVVADLESHDSFVVDIETIGGLNPIRTRSLGSPCLRIRLFISFPLTIPMVRWLLTCVGVRSTT